MTIHHILKMGDARLLRIAEPVLAFDTPQLHTLIADMRETMAAVQGAGLAAPQIGVNWQVVIFGSMASNPRYPDRPLVPPHGADQPADHAHRHRPRRGLGGVSVGARSARRGAALGAAALHRF